MLTVMCSETIIIRLIQHYISHLLPYIKNQVAAVIRIFSLYRWEHVIENWGLRTAAQNEATFKQLIEVVGENIAHHAGVMAGPERRIRKPVVD